MFGVRVGLACSISATVPATTGAAMLVPLSVRYGMERQAQRGLPAHAGTQPWSV